MTGSFVENTSPMVDCRRFDVYHAKETCFEVLPGRDYYAKTVPSNITLKSAGIFLTLQAHARHKRS
jgi:hypothetical protein